MSDTVQLAAIGVALALVNGVLVVLVGQWADARRKRSDAATAATSAAVAAGQAERANEHNELVKVRMEYRERIEKLEKRLDEKDAELKALHKELADARVVVAQQAARITDLESDLAALHRDRGHA